MINLARLRQSAARLRRNQRGVAAVEFGFIASIMAVLMLGAYDLTSAYVIQRDVRRMAVEINQGLANCGRFMDCALANMNSLMSRKANVMPGFANADLGMAFIARKNNVILVQGGPMTYLPTDIDTQAKALLVSEGDCGVVTLLTYKHTPLFPGMSADWGLTLMNLRSFAVALSQKDCKVV